MSAIRLLEYVEHESRRAPSARMTGLVGLGRADVTPAFARFDPSVTYTHISVSRMRETAAENVVFKTEDLPFAVEYRARARRRAELRDWLESSAMDLAFALEKLEADVPEDELDSWLRSFGI